MREEEEEEEEGGGHAIVKKPTGYPTKSASNRPRSEAWLADLPAFLADTHPEGGWEDGHSNSRGQSPSTPSGAWMWWHTERILHDSNDGKLLNTPPVLHSSEGTIRNKSSQPQTV